MSEERKFQIHNTTRDPRTRLQRAKAAQHQKTTLLLAGVRIFRNRPSTVPETVLQPEASCQPVSIVASTTSPNELAVRYMPDPPV